MIRELQVGETGLAYLAIRALRTDLGDEHSFVRSVDETLRAEGYRLVGAFEETSPTPLAVAGFRLGHGLSWGRYLYVDDLSTLPDARRRGHAGRLLDWLVAEARRLGCDQLHLDSGVGPHRADAHRLYLGNGYQITGHHFTRHVRTGA